jgi:hypothetical protein
MSNDPNISRPASFDAPENPPGSPVSKRPHRAVGVYDRPEKQGLSPTLIAVLVILVLLAVALSIFLLTR